MYDVRSGSREKIRCLCRTRYPQKPHGTVFRNLVSFRIVVKEVVMMSKLDKRRGERDRLDAVIKEMEGWRDGVRLHADVTVEEKCGGFDRLYRFAYNQLCVAVEEGKLSGDVSRKLAEAVIEETLGRGVRGILRQLARW